MVLPSLSGRSATFTAAARAGLGQSLSAEKLAGDAAYLAGEGRASYERPYGLAWLRCLAEELHTWDDEDAQQWSKNLAPLETEAANRIRTWLPKLYYPIRTGEHSQTAFAFGLILDWAEAVEDEILMLNNQTVAGRILLMLRSVVPCLAGRYPRWFHSKGVDR